MVGIFTSPAEIWDGGNGGKSSTLKRVVLDCSFDILPRVSNEKFMFFEKDNAVRQIGISACNAVQLLGFATSNHLCACAYANHDTHGPSSPGKVVQGIILPIDVPNLGQIRHYTSGTSGLGQFKSHVSFFRLSRIICAIRTPILSAINANFSLNHSYLSSSLEAIAAVTGHNNK